MKVVHIESGLGNQMLSFCEYLALKKANPQDDVYIENIIFDIPECNEVISQWNGYELNRVFAIDAPNVRSLFDDVQWNKIMAEIRASRFWVLEEHNWNYPVVFTTALNNAGLNLKNIRGNFESPEMMAACQPDKSSLACRLRHTLPFYYLQAWRHRRPIPLEKLNCISKLFLKTDEDIFTGQWLSFKYKESGIEQIAQEIEDTFVFPEVTDEKNKDALGFIGSRNSVAIHARRGDMLGVNYVYYATGFFKRAVKYIRKHVENPVFFIFCDPGSVGWAMENAEVLGLNVRKDEIHFVDWNKSTESYRDMQLMAACKHQIITNSTFGWWGAWMNKNPNKITISPEFRINTTHTF